MGKVQYRMCEDESTVAWMEWLIKNLPPDVKKFHLLNDSHSESVEMLRQIPRPNKLVIILGITEGADCVNVICTGMAGEALTEINVDHPQQLIHTEERELLQRPEELFDLHHKTQQFDRHGRENLACCAARSLPKSMLDVFRDEL